jgi:hypothetical protein
MRGPLWFALLFSLFSPLPVWFLIRAIRRLRNGIEPPPLEPGAPDVVQRVWRFVPVVDVIFLAFMLILIWLAFLDRWLN